MEKENEKIKVSLSEWKALEEQAEEMVENPLDAFNDQPMIPTKDAIEAKEKLNNAELVLTLQEYKELSEKAKETEQKTEETTLTYRPDGEKPTTIVQTREAAEAQRFLNLGKVVMLTPEEKKELEDVTKNTLTITLDDEESEVSPEVAEARSILAKAELMITPEEEKELKDVINNTLTITLDDEASRGSAEVAEARNILAKAEVIAPEKDKEIKDMDGLPADVIKDPWDLEEYGTTREEVNGNTAKMLEEMKEKPEKGDDNKDKESGLDPER